MIKLIQQPRIFLLACAFLLLPMSAYAQEEPHLIIEKAVHTLLQEFSANREQFAADKTQLFELVDQLGGPLFDFQRISKLVLASNWKQASEQQRNEFIEEFKKLLIRTYAIALFNYTGKETIRIIGSEVRERKNRKLGKVKSEVILSGGQAVAVDYAMILDKDGHWKIYNLIISDFNMITNYRDTYGASVARLGLDGVIESMKESNIAK